MSPSTFRTVMVSLLIVVTIAPAALAAGNSQAEPIPAMHISPQRLIQGDGENLRTPVDLASSLSAATVASKTDAATEAAMRAAAGQAKSEQPVTASVVVVRTNGGFEWADAGIGAATAAGAIMVLVGVLMFARTARRHTSGSTTPQPRVS